MPLAACTAAGEGKRLPMQTGRSLDGHQHQYTKVLCTNEVEMLGEI